MSIFDTLVVQPIFNLLVGLYAVIPGGDFGLSVILFTILLRFALYPLVKKQLHQVKAMRRLQPELEKLKKRNKDNKQLQAMEMMELYKKNGVSPFRSIGILLIQLPIFIALYYVIRIFTTEREKIEQFAYGFMEGIPAVKQLIDNPEQFNETLFGVVDLTKVAISSNGIDFFLVFLAVAAAVTQYIMSRQTMPQAESKKRLRDVMSEAAAGKEADQAEINNIVMMKMMKVLPFFMFVIMINLPGALALYYAVSNLVAVVQQHYILKQDETELVAIANESMSVTKKSPAKPKAKAEVAKKKAAKARAKDAAEGTVVRVVAKDDRAARKKKAE